jgi:hypothetical protein
MSSQFVRYENFRYMIRRDRRRRGQLWSGRRIRTDASIGKDCHKELLLVALFFDGGVRLGAASATRLSSSSAVSSYHLFEDPVMYLLRAH